MSIEWEDRPEEYDWTVEQWAQHTRGWTEVDKLFAKFARQRTYEDRKERGGDLFEIRYETGAAEYAEMISTIWSFPDDVLDRLIASFDLKD
ncbi:hypothetical protein HY086_02715 [Candidatus Gottesmanbacteria bacterium]|nr:hypothetical protein [Candidatus Gottesmanbacteria bacterium]